MPDNNPSGPCGLPLKALEAAIPNYRYLPWSEASGTAVRDRIFAEAQGEFVLCMDCHVFLPPGALNSLMAFLEMDPGISDLLQGPLINDDLSTLKTHMRPEWRNGFYGVWDFDSRGADAEGEPFDIPMQGLGLFVCRKDAWPGFNPRFRGFGGEEGYIHEKFRIRGNRTLCVPFLRWLHRFGRPLGVPYPNNWWDRIRNYLIGFHEVGLPISDLKAHMEEMVGKDLLERAYEEFERELGRAAIADR